MRLISEEKIHSQVEKYANRSSLDWLNFIDGAYFAETELQNLAVEFGNWLYDNVDMAQNKHEWDDYIKKMSTEKCFEEFLKERNK